MYASKFALMLLSHLRFCSPNNLIPSAFPTVVLYYFLAAVIKGHYMQAITIFYILLTVHHVMILGK